MSKDKYIRTGVRRCAALVCAAAYLLGGMEVLPEFLALGAWLEGSHSVRIALGGDQVTVVLRHERIGSKDVGNSRGATLLHRHGPVARVICLLDSSSATPDHVARFNPSQLSESARQIAKVMPERSVCERLLKLPEINPSPTLFPPAATCMAHRVPDTLSLLSSTVLVI
jgi:hypothetical protein